MGHDDYLISYRVLWVTLKEKCQGCLSLGTLTSSAALGEFDIYLR